MKKAILFSIGITGMLFLSCRQNDDILSTEDVATLKVIQQNRNARELNSVVNKPIKNDSVVAKVAGTDDAIKPPKL